MLPTMSFFGYDISSYTICVVVGLLVATMYVGASIRGREDLDGVQLVNIVAVSGLGAFVGAHILFAITKIDLIIDYVSNPEIHFYGFTAIIRSFLEVFGGMVFYGGLIGGFLTGLIYIKRLQHIRLNPFIYVDVYAPAIPLFHAFGRVGCFLGGCCYGIECRFGFMYHSAPIPESNGVTRLPIQLIESVGNLLIFFILHFLSKKEHRDGIVFASYILIYSVMRFLLEFFRGDTFRGFLLGFSTSQWVSIIMFTLGCISIRKYRLLQKREGVVDT